MRDIKTAITNVHDGAKIDRLNDIIIHIPPQKQVAISGAPVGHGKISDAEMLVLNQLFADKQYDACLAQARAFVSRDPRCLGARFMIAKAALSLNQTDLAFATVFNILKTESHHPLAHYFLCEAYLQNNDLEKSLHHAKLAYKYSYDVNFFLYVLIVDYKLGYFDNAIKACENIALQPKSPEINYNLAFCLLANRQYQQGWQYYENRLLLPLFETEYTHSSMPYWDGTSDLQGKKLLVIWEQGIGDNIQFVRFLPILKRVTQATIYLYCGSTLKSLLDNTLNIDAIVTEKNPNIQHDYKVYLLSLPLLLGIHHEDKFMTTPYITANTQLHAQWQERLSHLKQLKIGICWKGGQEYILKKARDCTLDKFIQLLQDPHHQLISLQKNLNPAESETLHYVNILNLEAELTDLTVTAAVIANLDLVITVDTAIAHLAGAMGKPVWTLIRWETEWRHPRDRDISPWYPSMRLFRQANPGDWDSVFDNVIASLQRYKPTIKLENHNKAAVAQPVTLEQKTIAPTASEAQLISAVATMPQVAATVQDMQALNQLFSDNQYETCMAQAKALLKRDPNCLGALVMIARAAIPLGQLGLAFGILWCRLNAQPNNPLIHYLLAFAYKALGHYDKSLIHAQTAVNLEPNNIAFCELLAKNYFDIGDCKQALKYYGIMNENTQSYDTLFNMSLAMLNAREYKQGWTLYENRLRLKKLTKSNLQSSMPSWDGKTDITDKKLLVICEQGKGDVIQFLRFIPLLKQRTQAHIYLACHPSMARIAMQIPGLEMILTTTDLPAHDYKLYLLSLPWILGIFAETQFITDAYVKADAALVDKWHQKLSQTQPYKIGICWMGASQYQYNIQRNCPLRQFIKLLENTTCQFISLQKELSPVDKDILAYSPILNVGDELSDFAETAAVIANVDLVISVDTAVAHLAGAMGKPVWTLIRYETEWRHPRDCNISPWYPSMRLFRQAKPGDWDSVMTAVTEALTTLFPLAGDADERK